MYDIVVYLSSLPKIADRDRKVQVLRNFYQGLKQLKINAFLQDKPQVVDAKVAVILGWLGSKVIGSHLQIRKAVIEQQSMLGRKVMSIDSSCFKFADNNSVFLRYSLDGVFYSTSNYANKNSNADRWDLVRKNLNLTLHPWRKKGNHILVCLQRDGGWSMKGNDISSWADTTVKQLKKYTDKPIVIRQHPRSQINVNHLLSYKNVSVSNGKNSLQQDIAGAWASVFYNSSSSVASVLQGVPVFVSDSDCVSWDVANHALSSINDPVMPSREQWLYDLSAAHWTDEDSTSGRIYQHFLPHITTNRQ